MILRFLALIFALVSFIFAAPVAAQEFPASGKSDNVEVRLISARTVASAGETFHVALVEKIASGWHTYWRNPGDSGEPTEIVWTLPQGVTASAIKWPVPTAIPFGPLVNYGYSGEVVFPIAITVPATAAANSTLDLVADVRWLECADICIPAEAKLSVRVAIGATASDSADAPRISQAISALPSAFPGSALLTDLGTGGMQLVVKGIDTPRDAYFFPDQIKTGALIDFAQPQELVRGKDGFGLTLVKSPSFPADLSGDVGGVLVVGKGASAKAYDIKAAFGGAAPITSGASTTPSTPNDAPIAGNLGLGAALGLAFLGGLLLNLMPCVFPILSMKVLGLVSASQGAAKAARTHGLWYGGGVIVSFLALAGVLIALKSAGAAVGWGFQLQNPAIVIILAVVMTLIGFNLLGFFEIGTSLQNLGNSATHQGSPSGSAMTGVLAVIVAAPCTAPFMGAALGFAATQSTALALLVFLALGLGFALPFVALTFMPALLAKFPRPGPWMVRLREILAFPMFATAIWLIWVVTAQAGQAGVLAALVGVFAASLAVWIARVIPSSIGKIAAVGVLLGGLVWAGLHAANAQPTSASRAQGPEFGETWSPERVAQLQGEGKTVFVNFTADWCVTCKVNEASVFSDTEVRTTLMSDKAAYLVADWTLRDGDIAAALAQQGRVGVPLYLVYKPGQQQPIVLPQILTKAGVISATK